MYAFNATLSLVDSTRQQELIIRSEANGSKRERRMQNGNPDRGLFYPRDLGLCQRVFEQVRIERGFELNSLEAEDLAAYVLLRFQNGTVDESALLGAARKSLETVGTVDYPYNAADLAEKYDLTLKSAAVILASNGPSRRACDAAASAFVAAVSARMKQWTREPTAGPSRGRNPGSKASGTH